jgi:hypothetical protein
VDNVLPERPESEEMVRQYDEKADEDTVCRSILPCRGAPQCYGNDGLGKIQQEILYRDPEDQPYQQYEGIGEDNGEERRCAAGALEDVGEGGES